MQDSLAVVKTPANWKAGFNSRSACPLNLRAVRRHHYGRLKQLRKSYWAYVPEHGSGALGILINTPKRCGRPCCKNPRRNGWYGDGGKTRKEHLADLDMREQLEEVKMETSIKEALQETKFTQREEFVMRAFVNEERSCSQIGDSLGISPEAVEKELRSALDKIKLKISIWKKGIENNI